MNTILRTIKRYIPKRVFKAMQPAYHFMLAWMGAVVYRFPSRHLRVVFITGTKGKTSTAELVVALLEAAGYTVALAGTLRFKIGTDSRPNRYHMTIPGRFFVQHFLRKAVRAQCDWAVIEMTSEGAVQHRHRFIHPDALIFTNLSPEHIESHGSYENYVAAKLSIASALERSRKNSRVLVANENDKETPKFVERTPSCAHVLFTLNDAKPYEIKNEGIDFTFKGTVISAPLSGEFNLYNILAAAAFAAYVGITPDSIKKGIETFKGIRGRVEKVAMGQNFQAIVDYAHTPDSLESLYKAFTHTKTICVLGSMGGGRDKWKRKAMAEIADAYCSSIIFTNEDPCDEDPMAIAEEMRSYVHAKPARIIIDRREAIRSALMQAKEGEAVLMTGKGTDPCIIGPNDSRIPWDEATVVREELANIMQ